MIKKAIVIPDIHYPLHSQPALNVIEKAIPIIRPDVAILLGDVGELDTVSSWKYKKKKRPNLEDWTPKIDAELDEVNGLLDQFDTWFEGCQEKHFCEGNHEVWLDNFVEEHPYLPQYSPQEAFHLEGRGYEYHKYGDYLKLGQLYYYHGGHYAGKYHNIHHLVNLQSNVCYAHNHGVGRASMGGLNGVHSSFCIGSLKRDENEANKWLKGRVTNWSHAFAIVYYNDEGIFRNEVVDITDGWTVLYGREINGN
jgi:hypothetical protein